MDRHQEQTTWTGLKQPGPADHVGKAAGLPGRIWSAGDRRTAAR